MTEAFTSITYEVYIGSAWVSLTADVLADPPPTCSRGISGNDLTDVVADPGRLTFSLNNAADNSAGLIGYYSPGHTNCLSGWTTSLPIRVRFTYDTWTREKFYGRIEPDGIKVLPGVLGQRRVEVSCLDYMGLCANHKIDLLTAQSNIQPWEAVELLLDNMPYRPQRTYYYDRIAGTYADLPVAFDTSSSNTTASSELQKIAVSSLTRIILRTSDETGEELAIYPGASVSVFGARQIGVITSQSDNLLLESGDDLLLETGDFLLLDQTTAAAIDSSDIIDGEFQYGRHLYNHFTLISYPRKTDAAATTVLWTLEEATPIAAGESITMRGAYRDPSGGSSRVNGTDMVTPVSGTDYKANASADGTGADLTASLGVVATYGAAEAELTLTNNHASTTLYVGGDTAGAFLQVRGKGVYTYDAVRLIFSDSTSITTHGTKPYTIEYKYSNIPSLWADLGDLLVAAYKDPHTSCDTVQLYANRDPHNMALFLFTEPRDYVTITDTLTAYDSGSWNTEAGVQSVTWEVRGKQHVFWTIKYIF